MKLLLTRAKSFHKPDGKQGAPDSILTLSPGQIEAPEWIRGTGTFQAGVADGSIRDFAPADSSGVFVPTKEQLLEKGYAPDVADEILVRQRELAVQFAAPEPAAKTEPAVDLKTLGLEGASSEPVQFPPKAPKVPKANPRTK